MSKRRPSRARVLAAQKGWRTRRATAAKRSIAAKKGAATRAKNKTKALTKARSTHTARAKHAPVSRRAVRPITKRTRAPKKTIGRARQHAPRKRQRPTTRARTAQRSSRKPTAKHPKRSQQRRAPRARPRKPRVGKTEYAVTADYARGRRSNAVSIQLSIVGPSNATREQIERAIETKLETGIDADGFRIKAIDWGRGRSDDQETVNESLHAFRHAIRAADIDIRKTRTDEELE